MTLPLRVVFWALVLAFVWVGYVGLAHGLEISTVTWNGQCHVTLPMDRPEFEIVLDSAPATGMFTHPMTNHVMKWDGQRWNMYREEPTK